MLKADGAPPDDTVSQLRPFTDGGRRGGRSAAAQQQASRCEQPTEVATNKRSGADGGAAGPQRGVRRAKREPRVATRHPAPNPATTPSTRLDPAEEPPTIEGAPVPIQVLNGPNLGRLGTREPEIYGTTTHAELAAACEQAGREIGVEVVVRQTDAEHELLGWLHDAADAGDPVVLNPGGWTHTSVAVRDACAGLTAPLVEVHLSNVHAREDFRRHSYVSPVATAVIAGLGVDGYLAAIRWLAARD